MIIILLLLPVDVGGETTAISSSSLSSSLDDELEPPSEILEGVGGNSVPTPDTLLYCVPT